MTERAFALQPMAADQDRQITEAVDREGSRLRRFIRRRVPDPRDVDDILQEVFSELVEANRLLVPIDHVTGWLFRVARNRITDLFRRRRPVLFSEAAGPADGEAFADLLPSADAGPDALYLRSLLLEDLQGAIEALPADQRAVFVGHEIEGRSFKEMASATGTPVNTLLSRKRYAIRFLRRRLQRAHDELFNR